MLPVSPCKEPESPGPITLPKILFFRNDSSLPCFEPSSEEPTMERFQFARGYPNTMLMVMELPEELRLTLPQSVDEEYDEEEGDESRSIVSSANSLNGWKSAFKNKFGRCFRPSATQSFRRVIPLTPSVISSPRRSSLYCEEDHAYRCSSFYGEEETIIEEDEEEIEEEVGRLSHDAVEMIDASYPPMTPTSSSSSPSNHGEVY